MAYQGWTNWETWHTALLIDNERDLYDKKVKCIESKCSLADFRRSLKKAEDMTRKLHSNGKRDNPDGNWGNFEKVNWAEIHKNAKNDF